jgi:hypothetical protein
VLVVVGVMPSVAVDPVQVVVVIRVPDRAMAARRTVDVHVAEVGDVRRRACRVLDHVVDVVAVRKVHTAVVQEVDVVVMRQRRVAAEPVMPMGMLGGLEMRAAWGVGSARVGQAGPPPETVARPAAARKRAQVAASPPPTADLRASRDSRFC